MGRYTKLIPLGALLIGVLACSRPVLSSDRATPESTVTPIPVNTPTPTSTPLPTATPTPLPAARVELGDRAIFYGDWESAFWEYQTALEASEEGDVRDAARLGIARTHFLAGNLTEAQDILEGLISEEIGSPLTAETYFFLAQVQEAQENHQAAAEAYAGYLELRPGVVDAYMHEQKGDSFYADGDFEEAIAAYQAALSSPGLNDSLETELKMAMAYDLSGDQATAVVAYQDLYDRTPNDFTRAGWIICWDRLIWFWVNLNLLRPHTWTRWRICRARTIRTLGWLNWLMPGWRWMNSREVWWIISLRNIA